MSSSITLKGLQLLPLWRRRIPKYPVYWKGDPQLRLFLPQFWMRIVKPEYEVPPNHAHFEVHPQMSDVDIKNYLEKIYKVPVMDVRTKIHRGEDIKHKTKSFIMDREPNKKYAFVTLNESEEFKFPDIFENKTTSMEKEVNQMSEVKRLEMEEEQKSWDKMAIPPWFR